MIKVAVRMPAAVRDAGEFLADVRALEAAGADAIWVAADSDDQWVLLGAVAALTQRIRIGLAEAYGAADAAAALNQIAGGRVLRDVPGGELWSDMPMPPNRQAWFEELRRHEEAGAVGVVVPWDARLIDLLRNPGEDDRSDLLMSTG